MDTTQKDFRSLWHPTVRNNDTLSAEDALVLFHSGIFEVRPIAIEEFLSEEFIERRPKEDELFHERWMDSFEMKILHTTVKDIAQFVCEFTCLDGEGCEYIKHDIVSLKMENGLWKICSVHKLLLSDENVHPTLLPVLGKGVILPGTQTFVDEYGWNLEESSGIDLSNAPDLALEICQEMFAGWHHFPQDVKRFYLDAVGACYDSDTKMRIDFFKVELN